MKSIQLLGTSALAGLIALMPMAVIEAGAAKIKVKPSVNGVAKVKIAPKVKIRKARVRI